MTEPELRQSVVNVMRGWLGWSEDNGKFRGIIDLYNAQKPLPVGYKVKYTDEWCATCVSAAGIKAGLKDIILPECSCVRMIQLYKERGRWMEDDAYIPQPGDIIMYDWQDSGVGDNTGVADHVGIVAEVNGRNMVIIEGNKGRAVSTRNMAVDGKLIRGYCLPDYASKATKIEEDENMTYELWLAYMQRYEAAKAQEPASDWAVQEGVLERATAAGISDGARPKAAVTREECMAIALRTLEAAREG